MYFEFLGRIQDRGQSCKKSYCYHLKILESAFQTEVDSVRGALVYL